MPAEKARAPELFQKTQWASLIEEMRQWPAEASEWEVIEAFIDQVQQVASQKHQERDEAGRVQRLQQELTQLRENHESDLAFFNFSDSDLAHWQANHCPIEQVPEQTDRVRALLEHLVQRRALDQQVPQNVQEARQHRADMEAVEDRISAGLDQLNQGFSAPTPTPPQDDQPPAEPPSPSSDAPDSTEDVTPAKEVVPEEKAPREDRKPTPPPAAAKPRPLRPVREVAATLLQGEDDDENWVSLGWSLLAAGDWAGAYWLARSLQAADRDIPVAPQLLAVLQGSRWLENDTDKFVLDVLEIASEWAPQNTPFEQWLGLSAALRPSLIAPQTTGLIGWLPQRDEINPALGALADAVRTFAAAGHALQDADLREVTGEKNHKEIIENTVGQARRFLATNKDSRLKFKGATRVLHHLVSQNGALHLLLTPVIENKAAEVNRVRQHMRDFKERRQIVALIHQMDQELGHSRPKPSRPKPIMGRPIDQLVRSVEEAVGLAGRWCSLIEQQALDSKGNWWSEHVNDLLDRVRGALPGVRAELDRMQADPRQEEAALGRVLHQAVGQVLGMLGIEEQPDVEGDAWMKRESDSLEGALAHRLLWIPEASLTNEGHPAADREADIAKALCQSLAEERSLRTACTLRVEGLDFRFTDASLNALEALEGGEARREYENRLDEDLKGAQAALADQVAKVQGAIEQGIVDGLLSEEERDRLNAELPDAENSIHIQPLFQRLENIERDLAAKLNDRLQELAAQWRKMRRGLARRIPPERLEATNTFIRRAIRQCDTRVVEESLALLRGVAQGESEWKSEWFTPTDTRDVFEEFQDACRGIESGLGDKGVDQLSELIEQGQTWAGVQFGELPRVRRDEAVAALRVWHRLKRQPGRDKEIHRPVRVLLEFLGFHVSAGESAVRVEEQGQDGVYCAVEASAGDLARPIPQLGSQAHGRYNVVCLWERPGADTVGAFLRDLGLDTKTVLIFFLGRLTSHRRNSLARRARERGLALVVLDEVLLVFLARFDDTRLPAFLRCSLPYAALNPYTPFQAGNVPPEMFYGRGDMVRQLQGAGGAIAFGGRQLGKSALLRQVEREFHQPDRDQFAWVEDIKLVGDPLTGEQPASLWSKLREGFKKHQLIKSSVTANQPDNIIKRIERSMAESPQRQVLVLFDEADRFLDADAKKGFPEVDRLRTLIQDTKSRFRVVFAGLHDVQRFKNIANQPLAHFGHNLLVGPLEARPARELVREPLKTLGYRFADETTVLKVLSYTNYHPGLIQYFCRELLHRLQAQNQMHSPPYKVQLDDVDAVYRLPQTREVIRERLDWTLALDSRYQCIAWAMIHEQKETSDSYTRSFSVAELQKLAREWCPQGFNDLDLEALRGLLGEMVGLGILLCNSENKYSLRSPNLVRLMGTEEDIENRLLELDTFQPLQSIPHSQHILLNASKRLYSPLTLVQEGRLLQAEQAGVSLIFGSQALGLEVLKQALKRMGGMEWPNQDVAWLDASARRQQPLFYRPVRGTGGNMAHFVWHVLNSYNKKRQRPRQVVFLFEPATSWAWLKSPKCTALEDQVNLIFLRRWDEEGIRQRLDQAGKLDLPECCGAVLQATGGWSLLLDELLRRCGDHNDPRDCVKTLGEEIDLPKSELGFKLVQQIGFSSLEEEEPFRVLQTLVEYKSKVAEEDLADLVEFVKGDPPLSLEDCKAAVELLYRLGCLEKRDGAYQVESVLGRVVGTP